MSGIDVDEIAKIAVTGRPVTADQLIALGRAVLDREADAGALQGLLAELATYRAGIERLRGAIAQDAADRARAAADAAQADRRAVSDSIALDRAGHLTMRYVVALVAEQDAALELVAAGSVLLIALIAVADHRDRPGAEAQSFLRRFAEEALAASDDYDEALAAVASAPPASTERVAGLVAGVLDGIAQDEPSSATIDLPPAIDEDPHER